MLVPSPNELFLIRLYIAIFGEIPKDHKFDYYLNKLNNNSIPSMVANEMVLEKNKELISERDSEKDHLIVMEIYKNIMNRNPSTSALLYWVGFTNSVKEFKFGTLAISIVNLIISYNGTEINAKESKDFFMKKQRISKLLLMHLN